jgi:hypothetical protein
LDALRRRHHFVAVGAFQIVEQLADLVIEPPIDVKRIA